MVNLHCKLFGILSKSLFSAHIESYRPHQFLDFLVNSERLGCVLIFSFQWWNQDTFLLNKDWTNIKVQIGTVERLQIETNKQMEGMDAEAVVNGTYANFEIPYT